jgi:hypothetical protein
MLPLFFKQIEKKICVPHLATNNLFIFVNELGLGAGIDPGMALTNIHLVL